MTRASRFEGTIGRTLADSQPWFDEPPHPGPDAPNVSAGAVVIARASDPHTADEVLSAVSAAVGRPSS